MNNKYKTKSGQITTSISGGRKHYGHRLPVRATQTYSYDMSYGENFYTLSTLVFGTDEYWWVLADINPPMDAFELYRSRTVLLPSGIVKDTSGISKFV